MRVGGGLYDHDPEPDRYQEPGEKFNTPLVRERAFWAVMGFGVWVAFQGMPSIMLWFLLTIVAVACAVFVMRMILDLVRGG